MDRCTLKLDSFLSLFKCVICFLPFHSTFGVTGNKWRLAAKATVTTMTASFGGGLVALIWSLIQTRGKVEVLAAINGVLGALVGITGTYNGDAQRSVTTTVISDIYL